MIRNIVKTIYTANCILLMIAVFHQSVLANNLIIDNARLVPQGNNAFIEFDISWENSWRNDLSGTGQAAPYNYDAVWLFVKYKDLNGVWQHANLSSTNTNHQTGSIGTDATINPRTDGVGAFIHWSTNQQGNFSSNNVQLYWESSADGLTDLTGIQVQVFGIEMVYIPEGAFWLGDGTTGTGDPGDLFQGQFRNASTNTPFQITSEAALTLGGTAADNLLANTNLTPPDDFTATVTRNLPVDYPKGFEAMYAMKYEITQQQYVDFLNTLSYQQQANVTAQLPGGPGFASTPPNAAVGTNAIATPVGGADFPFHTFVEILQPGVDSTVPAIYGCDYNGNDVFNEVNDGQQIACGYLTWVDGCAYADWAGLRPMSDLEFEKICRGPLNPVPNEFAWGDNNRIVALNTQNSGAANEIPSNATANVCAADSIRGPIRVGSFANNASTRAEAGASYYGVMEMSGNVWERCTTVGRPVGRAFTGQNGDGELSSSGYANTPNWCGMVNGEVRNGDGTGFRGGNFFRTIDFNNNYFNYALIRVSGRLYGNTVDSQRFSGNGFRAVMSAN